MTDPRDTPRPDDALAADDPLHRLTDAWAALPTPPATPDLDDTDAVTRAAVDWMRDAWASLPEPAEVAVPLAARGRVLRRRRADPTRWAAAAAVALATAWALWWGATVETPDARRAADTVTDSRTDDGADAADRIDGSPSAPRGTDAALLADARPRVVAATDDRIEMRAGSVRLVLLTATTLPTGAPSDAR